MTDNPRILIHPGFPKAGSTSIQKNVFSNHTDINFMSPCVDSPQDIFRDDERTRELHKLLLRTQDNNCDRIHFIYQHHFWPRMSQEKLNVLSDEAFLSSIRHSSIALMLKELMPKAHVLIVVRDQVDVLRSLYDMFPWAIGDHKRRYLSFSEWLDNTLENSESNISGALRYADIIMFYKDLFGTSNLTVISYEKLFNDSEAQVQLCDRLRIEASEFSKLIKQNPSNTASNHRTKKLVRRVLGPVKGSSFLTPGQIELIRRGLAWVVPDKKTEVSAAERAKIEAFYAGQRIADLPHLGKEGLIL